MAGTGFQGLTTGLRSGSSVNAGVYGERLKAFQENLSERKVLSNDSLFNEALAEEKKTEDFMAAARMGEVSPSSAKMYESHYALVKDMAEKLYSEETLDYFSQSDEGMAKWAKMVNELKQRVDAYEQFYELSYGDAKTANGNGFTWTDQVLRKNNGGNKVFFGNKGLSTDTTHEDLLAVLDQYDSSQHKNLELNFNTGEFEFEGDNNIFDITDPKRALNIFSFDVRQSTFEAPSDYATKASIYDTYSKIGPEALDDKLSSMRTDTKYQLAAIDYYLREKELSSQYTPQQVLNNPEIDTANITISDALDLFSEAIKEGVEARKNQEEKSKRKTGTGSDGSSSRETDETKITIPPIINVAGGYRGFNLPSYEDSKEVIGITVMNKDGDRVRGLLNQVYIDDEGNPKALLSDRGGELIVADVDDTIIQRINNIYGDGAYDKILEKMKGGGGGDPLDPGNIQSTDSPIDPLSPDENYRFYTDPGVQ